MSRPNIIYMNCHDTGRYLQPYGAPVQTPNLQRFAEDAVVFRQAYCMNPTCSPSRAALVTGMAPHNNGMFGLGHIGWKLNDYRQHWVHTLHDAGYSSWFVGNQHVAKGRQQIGYQNFISEPGESESARGVERFFKDAPKEPFYLEVGFGLCHRWAARFPTPLAKHDPRWVQPPPCLPDDPRTRKEFAGFLRLTHELDLHFGVMLQALEDSGLADNTLVICTTDHGIDFPHMKCTLRDDGIGVFLMMRGPKDSAWRGGKVLPALVSQIDVFPTICELAGIEPPEWLQGVSLQPLVDGEAEEVREEIYAEVNYHAAYQPMRCIRTKRWKYVRRYYDHPKKISPNQIPCPSRELWDEHGWRDREEPKEELYDLVFDPGEANNLAADPDHAAIRDDLARRLLAWMKETDDPILQGPIPLEEGCTIAHWDQSECRDGMISAEEWNPVLEADNAGGW